MIYNFTVLALRPNMLGAVMPKLADAIGARIKLGKLAGCWTCDFGTLNRIAILAEYPDLNALTTEREQIISAGDQFGFAAQLGAFEQAAFAPLSFAEPVKAGKYGPFYEIRTYEVAAGGLQSTSDAWNKGLPNRTKLSKLLTVMASIDTVPQRLMHIWPYASLDERAAVRGRASKEGIWPPPGSSDHLLSLRSELFVPTAFSPLT